MHSVLEFLPIAINAIVLAIVIAYLYGIANQMVTSVNRRNLIMGTALGVAASLAMLSPITLADGVIIDLRNLLVGLAAALFGVIGAVAAAGVAILTRVAIGGLGAWSGTVAIGLAALAGLTWLFIVKPRIGNRFLSMGILGVMISAHLFAAALLPAPVRNTFLVDYAQWFFVLNLFGTYFIAGLMLREQDLIRRSVELVSAATTDPLTQLLNRRSAIESFERLAPPSQEAQGIAMLCFDIDHFKQINDQHGHLSGDVVLLDITSRISQCLRPTDLFCRLGGDEFLIILPDVTRDETTKIAERCRLAVSEAPVRSEGRDIAVSISVGANWSRHQKEFTNFLSVADDALYSAKALGRDCVAYAFNAAQIKPPMLGAQAGASG